MKKVALDELPSPGKFSLPAIPQRASIAIRGFFRGLRFFSPVNEGTVSCPLRFTKRFARRFLFVGHFLFSLTMVPGATVNGHTSPRAGRESSLERITPVADHTFNFVPKRFAEW